MTQQQGGVRPDQWSRTNAPWGAPGPAWGPTPPQGPQGWPAPQAPGFPAPGRPPTRPRRRRGLFGTLLRIAVTVAALFFLMTLLRGFLDTAEAPTAPTRPTAPGTTAPGGGGTGTTGGTTGGTGGSLQYQNEGYQAPPPEFNAPALPAPRSINEANTWLSANPIYRQNVPAPTNCRMTPVKANTPRSELQDELNDMMGCLMAVWEPPLRAAGFEMPRPPITVYSSKVTTACGVMKEVNAAYCAGDQQIYYAEQLLRALPTRVRATPYAAETVVAHEFGHAVQARTGILISDKALEQRAGSKAAELELSRRTEVQADCFGALYVASVAQSQGLNDSVRQQIVDLNYYLGDDVLSGDPEAVEGHGRGKTRQAWFARGVVTNQIGVCNSWTAPSSAVR